MNILIGILAYVLGFASCIMFVRLVVKIDRYNKKIQKAEEILKREEEKKKSKKIKENKVMKLVKDENQEENEDDNKED